MARQSDKQRDNDNAVSLTGHTTKPGIVEDPLTGKVQAVHETEVITDPNHELAVQVPSPEDNPQANGTATDPLRRGATPNDVANGDAEPVITVSDEGVDRGEAAAADPAAPSADVEQVPGKGSVVSE